MLDDIVLLLLSPKHFQHPDEVKTKRTSAKRIFTQKKNACLHAVDDELVDDIVIQRFEEVETAWKQVQLAHEEFMQVSGFPDDPEMDDWILDLESTFQELEVKRVAYRYMRVKMSVLFSIAFMLHLNT